MAEHIDADREILNHRIDQLQEHILYHARKGFASLRAVPNDQFRRFLDACFVSAERGEGLESEAVARMLGLDERFTSDAVLAASLTMGAVTDLTVTAEDFINSGRDKVFDVQDEDVVRTLASNIIERRSALRDAMERSSIANAILPAYSNSSVEVDVRLRFDDRNEVIGGAVVAIVGIRTDIEDDFYCQMTPDELRRFIKRLEEAEGRLGASTNLLNGLVR